MEITEKEVLARTHYGLNIYAHILRSFYPDDVVLHLSGKKCKPASNPFSGGAETLIIENQDWIFYYHDAGNPEFHGNPFDFATLYFKLSGPELLLKIDEELNLGIVNEKSFYHKAQIHQSATPEPEKPTISIPRFSFFKRPVKNTFPEKEISLLKVFYLIKGDTFKSNTLAYRQIVDKEQAKRFKAENFDYVTFSGIFSKRSDKDLLRHSGLITIDFDHIPDLISLSQALLNDEYFETEMLFVSPSGDGIKWIIPIDLIKGTHQLFFSAIASYIRQTYQLEVDKSGKDISRACFLPYDPAVYINPKYR